MHHQQQHVMIEEKGSMPIQRVLLTGATGFLGQALIRKLLSVPSSFPDQQHSHFEVYAIGRRVLIGKELESEYSGQRCKFVELDLSSAQGFKELQELCNTVPFHYVIHCAALCAPWGNPSDYWNANVLATKHLLDAVVGASKSHHTKHDLHRFIFVGSPSIFASVCFDEKSDGVVTRDTKPGGESGTFLNEYSKTKFEAEELSLQYSKEHNLPLIVIRPRALYGPGDTTLLPILLQRLASRKFVNLKDGDEPVWTELTHVEDAASAIVCAMKTNRHEAIGRCFNITGGEKRDLYDILKLIAHLMLHMRLVINKDDAAEIEEGNKDEVFTPRKFPFSLAYYAGSFFEMVYSLFGWYSSDPPLTRYNACILGKSLTFDISDAKELLNYEPSIPLDEGIEQVVLNWKKSSLGIQSRL